MANCSDVNGTIKIKNVAKEFFAFAQQAQKDACYTLFNEDAVEMADSDFENNSVEFPFWATGRWYYISNLNGYLTGKWFSNDEKVSNLLDDLICAINTNNGSVVIDYTDIEVGCMFIDEGIATLDADGFSINNVSKDLTVYSLAEVNEESIRWAIDYIYGDDVGNAWESAGKPNNVEEFVTNYFENQ